MFKIYDGREYFYQWDLDRKLVVEDPTVKEVHFTNRATNDAFVCETYVEDGKTLVNVPNILLQTNWRIQAYAYDGFHTKHDKCYEVKSRSKPSDYIYTETETVTVEAAIERAIASGEFKGEPGEPGEKGEPGEPGYTPQKGIDYFTPEDIASFSSTYTTKEEVESITGDIEKALDEIIAIEESLIGGNN